MWTSAKCFHVERCLFVSTPLEVTNVIVRVVIKENNAKLVSKCRNNDIVVTGGRGGLVVNALESDREVRV